MTNIQLDYSESPASLLSAEKEGETVVVYVNDLILTLSADDAALLCSEIENAGIEESEPAEEEVTEEESEEQPEA